MSFKEILELDCLEYRLLLKDALIHKLEQTEEGQDYLEKCWVLQQSTPDYDRLKEKYR